jgi:hypothetical protein
MKACRVMVYKNTYKSCIILCVCALKIKNAVKARLFELMTEILEVYISRSHGKPIKVDKYSTIQIN